MFFFLPGHLQEQLESYMSKYPIVKVVREKERAGLIRARLTGARHATGQVLTYLDSHCECTTGERQNVFWALGFEFLQMCLRNFWVHSRKSLSFCWVIYQSFPTGWLEPLLDRIARDPTTVVCPVIDVIDDDTLEYHFRDSSGVNVGGFDWNLQVFPKLDHGSFFAGKDSIPGIVAKLNNMIQLVHYWILKLDISFSYMANSQIYP